MQVADLVAAHRATAALLATFAGAGDEARRRATEHRPRAEDHELVFVAGAARAAYRQLWAARPEITGSHVDAAATVTAVCQPGRWIWFPSPWLFVGPQAIAGRPSPPTHGTA